MIKNFRIIDNGGSLSESDLSLLAGTEIVVRMMRNRLIVIFEEGSDIKWELLTDGLAGLYHVRPIDPTKQRNVFQIWFEDEKDRHKFKKNSMLQKLGATA